MGRSPSQAARQIAALSCISESQLFFMQSTSRNKRPCLHFQTAGTLCGL